MGAYLKKQGVEYQRADVMAFVQRADKDLDCKMSFEEFAAILSVRKKPSYLTPTKTSQAQRHNSVYKKHTYRSNRFKTAPKTNVSKPLCSIGKGESSNEFYMSSKKSVTKKIGDSSILLYRLMGEQLMMERRIESLKQTLTFYGHEDVIRKLYDILDTERKGYIKAIDLLELLQQLDINAKRETVANLFNKFDKNSDGKWTYFDVEELLTPAINYPITNNTTVEFIVGLKNLFEAYLDAEINAKTMKEHTNEAMIAQFFNECDKSKLNYLNAEAVILMCLL